jgi:hypothetical protein
VRAVGEGSAQSGSAVEKERVGEVGDEEVVGSVGRASPVVEALIAAKAGDYSNTLSPRVQEWHIQLFPAVPKANWTATRLEGVGSEMRQSRLRWCWGEEVCLRLRGEDAQTNGRHTAGFLNLEPLAAAPEIVHYQGPCVTTTCILPPGFACYFHCYMSLSTTEHITLCFFARDEGVAQKESMNTHMGGMLKHGALIGQTCRQPPTWIA